MTLDELKSKGCNTDEGMARCMNNEDFYLKMVNMFFADSSKFDALGKALEAHDLDDAFEQAHALKGVCANLALTPIQDRVSEITELLRSRSDMDYTDMYRDLMDCFNGFLS